MMPLLRSIHAFQALAKSCLMALMLMLFVACLPVDGGVHAQTISGGTSSLAAAPPPGDRGDDNLPYNDARMVNQSVQQTMVVNGEYDVWVDMINTGNLAWYAANSYRLGVVGGDYWGISRVGLPVNVNMVPMQGTVRFTFRVRAPATPGDYTFQWRMVQGDADWFGTPSTAVTVRVDPAPTPVNNAEVIDMSVPSPMVTGKPYTVAVTMRNNGTTTWAAGVYSLGSLNPTDNLIWGLGRVALPTSVTPGQQYTFSFPVTAPATGDYSMQWGMLSNVAWFGAIAIRSVTVTENLGNVTFIHTDGLGSPVVRTDGAGNAIGGARYEPYGLVASGATTTIGFTGHVNDADTGLTYMQQRYYDPVAGRFLSIDPVVTDANTGKSFNRYAYANNNPYRFIDPDGREAQITIGSSVLAGFQMPGVFGGVGGFIGGGLSVGITSNGQLIMQVNYTLSQGVGGFAGVGASVAVGGTKEPTSAGISTTKVIQFDANAGLGAAGGGSVQVPLVKTGQEADITGSKGVGGPKVGAGAGVQVSAGINTITTIATPPIIKVPEIIKEIFGD